MRMNTNTDIQDDIKQINLYANYKMDAFKFHVISQVQLYNDMTNMDGDDITLGFMAGFGVDYALANGFAIAGDLRFMDKNAAFTSSASVIRGKLRADPLYVPTAEEIAAVSDKPVVSYFAGITKGFSNGNIGAGVEVKTGENTGYAVPIRLEYSF